tara:strand:+ start:992 stop:1480 length:489 start_codon:yes stop_codon:yes gene_type:complete
MSGAAKQDLGDDFPLVDDGQDFGPVCIECGEAASSLVGGDVIYPHRQDLYSKPFWLCPCGAYCGCHPNTENPLGYPAGPQTRKARSALHRVLDPLWKGVEGNKHRRRNSIYSFLSFKLDIPRSETHSGMFSVEQCRSAIEALKGYDPQWRENQPKSEDQKGN